MNSATGDHGQTSHGPRLPSTGPVDADAEHRWRTLVEMSALAVLIVDDHGLVVYANPQAADLCGVATADDAIGRSAAEFADPVSVDVLLVDAAGTRVTDRSLTLVRADGSHVPTQVNAAAVRYAGAWCVQLEIRDLSRQVAVEQAARDAEARARSLIEQSPIGVAIADENFRFVEVNPAVCTILGRSATELIGLDSATLDLDNRTPEEITEQGDTIIDGLNGTEVRFTHPDGGERWLWLGISPFAGPQGQSWSLGHAIDITGQKHAETARRESEADVAAVTAVVQKMQSGGDARQIIVEAAMSLAGASFAALLEPAFGNAALIVTAATLELVVGAEIDVDGDSVPARGYLTGEPVFVADAQEHPGVPQELLELGAGRSMSAFPVRSGSDVVATLVVSWRASLDGLDARRTAAVSLLADQAGVTLRQAALLAELDRMAHNDPLTMLLNRRGWNKQLEQVLSLADRAGHPLTIALADIDFFKRYNDEFGHQAGDILLRDFATAAADAVRTHDVVARWGGEEFALALPNCSNADAFAVLDRIRQAVPSKQTCSIGFATWRRGESGSDVIARADRALYRAKTSGRNQIRSGEVELGVVSG